MVMNPRTSICRQPMTSRTRQSPGVLRCHYIGVHPMQVSRSVCQGLAITAADLCLAVCLGSTCHVAFLAFNALCVRVLSLGGQDRLEAARLRQALVLQVRALVLESALFTGYAFVVACTMHYAYIICMNEWYTCSEQEGKAVPSRAQALRRMQQWLQPTVEVSGQALVLQ
eukprot:scaffold218859_cov17-Tisochrysis_lutea.AAC.1